MLFGLALAIFSFWSAAARLRITARAPPGGGGESGRAVDWPEAGGEFTGDAGRGEDWFASIVSYRMSRMKGLEQRGGDRAGDGGEHHWRWDRMRWRICSMGRVWVGERRTILTEVD